MEKDGRVHTNAIIMIYPSLILPPYILELMIITKVICLEGMTPYLCSNSSDGCNRILWVIQIQLKNPLFSRPDPHLNLYIPRIH